LADALDQCAPLQSLRQRLARSQACFDAIRPAVPAALLCSLRPGPVDETGWTLLAANAATAAKLRQLRPRLEQALLQQGCQVSSIKVRVQLHGAAVTPSA
jgi:hypothetical protein